MRAEAGPPFDPEWLEQLAADPRAGARRLHRTCLQKVSAVEEEQRRLDAMFRFEREAAESGFRRIAGIDEAGRGPLAGPIVAAAVILDDPIEGLDDSKQLTAPQRDALYERIPTVARAVGVAIIEVAEIDRNGIQCSNYAAMAQAADRISPNPDFLLVDGFMIKGCPAPQKAIVKGDRLSASIAAASIIAKVTRDRIMDQLDTQYPGYGFAAHKGYGTQDHLDALRRLGPCPAHRRSFSPVSEMLAGMGLTPNAGTTGLLFE